MMIYGLLAALVVGMGAFLWSAYDGASVRGVPVRVSPATDRYKEPGPGAEEDTLVAAPVEDQLRNPEAVLAATDVAAPPEEPLAQDPNVAPVGPPAFVHDGAFVAQIAALQSEGGIGPLWSRLSDRAPDLFADAKMDVQRADLGARGVYLRVRVGYFADRENAARFCVRMRAMGQDCMAVER
jgi:hypothetical protein